MEALSNQKQDQTRHNFKDRAPLHKKQEQQKLTSKSTSSLLSLDNP